jgi:regulator of sigma E protease
MKNKELLINLLSLVVGIAAVVLFWSAVKGVVIFVVTLGILVAVHEWGHFIAAKAAGVRVYEFALGFGPKLITYMRRNGTDYTLRAFPIGGFVNPKGMQPDDPITSDGLNGRRPAERAMMYLAGPLMNAILCVIILLLVSALFGIPDASRVLVGNVARKSIAQRMEVVSRDGRPVTGFRRGLRMGDRVLQVNNRIAAGFTDVTGEIHPNAGKPVTIKVLRDGHELVLVGVPERKNSGQEKFLVVTQVPPGTDLAVLPGDQLVAINGKNLEESSTPESLARTLLGKNLGKKTKLTVWRNSDTRLELEGKLPELQVRLQGGTRWVGQLGFVPTYGQGPRVGLRESAVRGVQYLESFCLAFYAIFSHPQHLSENVGGPVAILDALWEVDRLPAYNYFHTLASLSFSLAVFNLLPIGVLDGGHLLVLAWEVVRRRRLDPETHKVVLVIGLAVVGVLFVLITGKDLWHRFR